MVSKELCSQELSLEREAQVQIPQLQGLGGLGLCIHALYVTAISIPQGHCED